MRNPIALLIRMLMALCLEEIGLAILLLGLAVWVVLLLAAFKLFS